jgi:hypothetical protein
MFNALSVLSINDNIFFFFNKKGKLLSKTQVLGQRANRAAWQDLSFVLKK